MSETPAITLEQVVSLARQLPPLGKIRLIELIAPEIEQDLREGLPPKRPRKSLLALCADLGPAPSTEDIDSLLVQNATQMGWFPQVHR
jgi:hypothetical protein